MLKYGVMNLKPLTFLILLIILIPALHAFADSDGYYCYGPGYLAYDLWREGYNRHLHIIRFGSTDNGIEKPVYIPMTGQPNGYRCDNGIVRILFWDRVEIYEIRNGKISHEGSEPIETKGRLIAGYAQQNLGAWARSANIALDAPDKSHRYELIIKKGEFITETTLIQYSLQGNPLKDLRIFEGNMKSRAYEFEVRDLTKNQKRQTEDAVPESIAPKLEAYKKASSGALVENARRIEAFIARTEDDRLAPRALYSLGHYKQRIAEKSFRATPDEFRTLIAFVKEHPKDYVYSEPAADILYNGSDWKEVFDRFPTDDYADDAAFYYFTLDKGGECEGDLNCYVEYKFGGLKVFLKKYPLSVLAAEAVSRANAAFTGLEVKDFTAKTEYYDPEKLKATLGEYEEIAGMLPPPLRAKAYKTIAGLWEKFLEDERAKRLRLYIKSLK